MRGVRFVELDASRRVTRHAVDQVNNNLHEQPEQDDRPRRNAYLHVTEQWILRRFGLLLRETFPTARAIVHVGSSIVRQDWRDVDVRIMLVNDDYEMVATVADVKALNVALSVWGQQFTRLPIDCQLQSEREHRTHSNKPLRSIGGLPR